MPEMKQLMYYGRKYNLMRSIGKAELFGIWSILLILNTIARAKCEIEPLIDCGVKNLCNGRTNPETEPSHYNSTLYDSMTAPCYCDKQCSKFGDCCMDNVDKLSEKMTVESWTCSPMYFNESVFTISTCAIGSGLYSYREKCEKTVAIHDYNYILDVPVLSSRSGLYYANIYCAHCHNQLSAVRYPRVTISCTSNITIAMVNESGEYQPGKLQWKVGHGHCILRVHKDKLQKGRQCLPSETNCRNDSDLDTKGKCKAYFFPVSVSDKIYRNPHCAICNGVNTSDLQCVRTLKLKTLKNYSIVSDFTWDFDKCNNTPEIIWNNIAGKCINSKNTSAEVNTTDHCINTDSNDLACQIIKQLMIRKIDAHILRTCLLLSLMCLLIHIFTSLCIPHRRTVSSKLLDSLALNSVVSQLLFLTGIYPPIDLPWGVCYTISILIQYTNLSTFFWMNAISFDVFFTFSDSTLKYAGTKKYSKYALLAWGGAAFATLLSVVADYLDFIPYRYRPRYASKMNVCWFGSRNGVIIFFYVPMSAIIVLNTLLFAITVCWFQKQPRSLGNIKKGKKDYSRVCLYFKLSIVMGASWIVSLLRFLTHHPIYRYLFTAFSGLQGTFIFIMFDLKKEAKFIVLYFRSLFHKQNNNLIQSTNKTSVRRTRTSTIRAV